MSSTTDTLAEMADVTIRVLQQTCCDQYRWMTIAAGIFGFLMAFGIGANDVANAFATSVSAKSISLVCAMQGFHLPFLFEYSLTLSKLYSLQKQAVLIAAICEFLGAMLLGASVTSTIRKVRVKSAEANPLR